ncbi:MAG TPA: ABC transporter ATP-binding protein, partial [Candidatus Latescibacteria bacterium]|nr:ABC transporter ATP-binding protein [Candidatus Latescibacterota bacterium]
MSSTLNIRGLSVSYGTHEALKNVNLSLQSGELLVVLGPTGAGKTTLLRTIAGLVVPDAGSVTIEGADTTHLPARDVAMVFQNFSLYPNRNVRQNLEFPLRSPTARLTQEQIIDRVEWAAELLRIRHLLNRPSTQLSGGEMQRVAIGRAIVRRPRVFLFDEPLTNLDAKLREVLRVELIKLQKELDVSTIYVTHDQAEALSMADRIAVLADGRITQTGSPSDIYERPDTPEVARQLGYPQINLMDATQDDGFWVSATGDRFAPAQSDAKTA